MINTEGGLMGKTVTYLLVVVAALLVATLSLWAGGLLDSMGDTSSIPPVVIGGGLGERYVVQDAPTIWPSATESTSSAERTTVSGPLLLQIRTGHGPQGPQGGRR